MKAAVLTVSDRAAKGERADASGPLAVSLLRDLGFDVPPATVVADGRDTVSAALRTLCASGVDLVVSTGGTGLGPRDETPEATAEILDRVIPGIAELVRSTGLAATPTACLSRGLAGVCGSALVVNLAGSPGAVRDGISVLAPVLSHAIAQLGGADH